MEALRLDRLREAIMSTEVVVGALWMGLAALSVALLLLARTRWGQSQPLRKCMVLSLLAHLLMVGYATTVRIVASAPLDASEATVHISIAEEDYEFDQLAQPAAVEKPWESFGAPSTAQLSPDELARAESVELAELERRPPTDFEEVSVDPTPAQFELDEAVRPEPVAVPAAPPGETPPSSKPAEPIVAPAAEQSRGVEAEGPAAPEVERRGHDDSPPAMPEPSRRSGVPSALVQQPQPVPRIEDIPTTPDPEDSLAAMADTLSPPGRGQPADPLTQEALPEGIPEAMAADRATGGPDGPDSDHLRPPSLAMRGGANAAGGSQLISLPADSVAIGPPILPIPRRNGGDHEVPDVYQLRVAPNRSRVAQEMGASEETEEAVKAALQWLAENQEPDGRWSANAHGGGRELMVAGRDRQGAGLQADSGMTGLALLAFLASGHTPQEGIYQDTVRRGVKYLVGQQDPDGGLGGQATTFAYMYCHAMAAFALSEAYGMTGDASLREPVHRAVQRTLNAQNPSAGGWRYYPGDPGDTSQLGWQLMMLKSAELAGLPMPHETRRGAVRFLGSVASGEHGGLAAYRPEERASRPMTAEALACRQFLGLRHDTAASREAGDYLLAELPGEGAKNFYYWYYGTLAMFQLQGAHWERWNRALSTTLVRNQRKSGRLAGSWDPDTVWGGYGGRVYSTALATLCLEVYYRFLPLYVEVASGALPRR